MGPPVLAPLIRLITRRAESGLWLRAEGEQPVVQVSQLGQNRILFGVI